MVVIDARGGVRALVDGEGLGLLAAWLLAYILLIGKVIIGRIKEKKTLTIAIAMLNLLEVAKLQRYNSWQGVNEFLKHDVPWQGVNDGFSWQGVNDDFSW